MAVYSPSIVPLNCHLFRLFSLSNLCSETLEEMDKSVANFLNSNLWYFFREKIPRLKNVKNGPEATGDYFQNRSTIELSTIVR